MKKIKIKHNYLYDTLVLIIFLLILIYLSFFKLEIIKSTFIVIKGLLKEIPSFKNIRIPLIVLLFYWNLFCYTIWKLYIGLNYFNSTEMCYIKDDNFIYERICYFWGIYSYTFEQKTIPILEIQKLKLLPYKKRKDLRTFFPPAWSFYVFTPFQRILIEYSSGEQFKIWNFRKLPNFWQEEKKGDKELIQKYYMDIKTMIDEKKKELEEAKDEKNRD